MWIDRNLPFMAQTMLKTAVNQFNDWNKLEVIVQKLKFNKHCDPPVYKLSCRLGT